MKASEVKVDIEEMKKFKEANALDRFNFIDFWANYIRIHRDEEWSRQQNVLINSQILTAERACKNPETEEGREKIKELKKLKF